MTTRDIVVAECAGRYCPCRMHLNPDMPLWVLDTYLPSLWALEVLHGIYADGRNRDEVSEDERAILVAELCRLVDNATEALS